MKWTYICLYVRMKAILLYLVERKVLAMQADKQINKSNKTINAFLTINKQTHTYIFIYICIRILHSNALDMNISFLRAMSISNFTTHKHTLTLFITYIYPHSHIPQFPPAVVLLSVVTPSSVCACC